MSHAAQTTSAMESQAPTSWNVTSSTEMPCTSASASARTVKMAVARSATGPASPLSPSQTLMSAKRAVGVTVAVVPTSVLGAAVPVAAFSRGFRGGMFAGFMAVTVVVRLTVPARFLAAPARTPFRAPPRTRGGGDRPIRGPARLRTRGVVWKRCPRRMPSVNGSERTVTISCRRRPREPRREGFRALGKGVEEGGGEHVAGNAADRIQVDVHRPDSTPVPRFPSTRSIIAGL